MNIISDRAAMSPAVETAIKEAIGDEYFVNVTAVVLTNIDFSDAFELAVEEKMIAEQKQLKAEYENQTKVAQAEADATTTSGSLCVVSPTKQSVRVMWIDARPQRSLPQLQISIMVGSKPSTIPRIWRACRGTSAPCAECSLKLKQESPLRTNEREV